MGESPNNKMSRTIKWLVILAILNFVFPSLTYSKVSTITIDTKASMTGACSEFGTPQTNLHSCDPKVLYQHYSNHRAAFVVQKTFSQSDEKTDPTGEYKAGRRLLAIFSGGRDRQAQAEEYYLFVDQIVVTLYDSGGGNPLGVNEGAASGNCHLVGDGSMTHVYRVTCSANYGARAQTNAITFDFTSDGTAVDVSHPFRSRPDNNPRGAAGIRQLDPNRPIGRFWIK
jgi:hypothetical protein